MANPSQMTRRAINVAEDERLLSLIVGPALILIARPRGWLGVLLALVGAELVYRGATGHCHVYEVLDIDRARSAAWMNERA